MARSACGPRTRGSTPRHSDDRSKMIPSTPPNQGQRFTSVGCVSRAENFKAWVDHNALTEVLRGVWLDRPPKFKNTLMFPRKCKSPSRVLRELRLHSPTPPTNHGVGRRCWRGVAPDTVNRHPNHHATAKSTHPHPSSHVPFFHATRLDTEHKADLECRAPSNRLVGARQFQANSRCRPTHARLL